VVELPTEGEPVRVIEGDCLEVLRGLKAESVQCCVTSPPYFGLRDYGHAGQIGLEPTPAEYVAKLVAVFREVRRVLRDDGTLWLNLGDSYAAGKAGRTDYGTGDSTSTLGPRRDGLPGGTRPGNVVARSAPDGFKPKDLLGIPWRVAFALQEDGWYLRQDIIWHKPNPMPESVRDRCTKAHEYLFLLSKSPRYFYDAAAIAECALQPNGTPAFVAQHKQAALGANQTGTLGTNAGPATRNRRSVWTVCPQPFAEAHFATFPPELIRPCVRAGCPESGVVLDPFGGAGTTGLVAAQEWRRALLVELNPDYAAMARRRITEGLCVGADSLLTVLPQPSLFGESS